MIAKRALISLAGTTLLLTAPSAMAVSLMVVDNVLAARDVGVHDVRYDVGAKRLRATTRAGNIVCTGGSAAGSGVLAVEFDGNSGGAKSLSSLAINPSTGTFNIDLDGLANCKSSGATILKLVLPGGGAFGIAESPYYSVVTKRFDVKLAVPLLCQTFGTAAAGGVGIDIVDSAGAATSLSGLNAINYGLSAKQLIVVPGQQSVQCAGVVAGSGGSGPPIDPNSIFSGHFEPAEGAADLAVTLAASSLGVRADASFTYVATVRNQGIGTAKSIVVRESLPMAIGPTRPFLDPLAWSCERFAPNGATAGACGTGGSVVGLDPFDLAAGESVRISASRLLPSAGQTLQLGNTVLVGFAAFADPNPNVGADPSAAPDMNMTNNQAALAFTLVNNQPPTVTGLTTQNVAEDAEAFEVAFSVTDSDGDSILSVTALSSDASKLAVEAPTLTGPGQYSVRLMPQRDQNGTVDVTIRADDGQSAPMLPSFVVGISPINDAPDFALATAELRVVEGGNSCVVGQACSVAAAPLIIDMIPGPPTAIDEASQIVAPVTVDGGTGTQVLGGNACRSVQGGPEPSAFFLFGRMPRLYSLDGGVSYELFGDLARVEGSVDCDITVRDDGAPSASSAAKTVRITYAAQ